MKTLVILIAVVVAVTAEEAGSVFNSLISGVSNIDDKDFQRCLDDGDNEAFQTAKAASSNLVKCFEPMKDEMNSIVQTMLGGGDARSEAKEICKIAATLNPTCHGKFMNAVRPCLSDNDRIAMELHQKVAAASSSRNCENNGEDLANVMQIEQIMCFGSHASVLHSCMSPLKRVLNQYGGETSLSLARSLLGSGCSIYKKIGPCIQEHLPCSGFTKLLVGGMNASSDILTPCPNESAANSHETTIASGPWPTVPYFQHHMTSTSSRNSVAVEEIQVLKSIQMLLKSIAETSKQQLEIETAIDARNLQAQQNEEKSMDDITTLMRKILYSIRQ